MTEDTGYNARITALERRVADLEGLRDKRAYDEHAIKSQAAATQATQHLYAPLRNDTKAITEMSAFVRRLALMDAGGMQAFYAWLALRDLQSEAAELLKRLT